MIKMLNRNGHPFEALESNVEAYKKQGAKLAKKPVKQKKNEKAK